MGTEDTIEQSTERRNRIRLSLFAYAYEFRADSMVDDGAFDRLALLVDTSIATGRPDLDAFFKEHFLSHTGQWIHNHPELSKLEKLYDRLRKSK